MANKITGTNLAGISDKRERVENDFYATPFEATREILKREELVGSILEPAAGQGHISKIIREFYPNSEIISTDLVEREDKFNIGLQGNTDFIRHNFKRKFGTIITNPPFKLAQQFVERALQLAEHKVIMFAKIQFLESKSRRELFEKYPPARIYVFSERVNPLRNGMEVDEKGKPWASTMCFAWFVWEKGFQGDTVIKWI